MLERNRVVAVFEFKLFEGSMLLVFAFGFESNGCFEQAAEHAQVRGLSLCF